MPKKKTAVKSKAQMKKDHKAEIAVLREEIESLKAFPPVTPTDRDEDGNIQPLAEPAAPVAVQEEPTKPERFKLPGGRPFRVVVAGDSVALTAKALGGGTATMMFQPDMARRVGMVLCKVSQQVAEQLQAAVSRKIKSSPGSRRRRPASRAIRRTALSQVERPPRC